MAKSISTKKAAEAAEAEAREQQRTYITMDEIPWDKLSDIYGIRKEEFLGESNMAKGRRDALLSGNWTPTFEAHKTTEGIHVEQTFSMRAVRSRDSEGRDDIQIAL